MNATIAAVTQTQSSEWWIERLEEAGIPCGPVNDIREVFADPQVQHLRMAAPVHSDKLGDIEVVNQPVELSRTPSSMVRATPEKGEHTDEVLADLLSLTGSEIAALAEAGTVRSGRAPNATEDFR